MNAKRWSNPEPIFNSFWIRRLIFVSAPTPGDAGFHTQPPSKLSDYSPMSSNDEPALICEAIRRRSLLQFRYQRRLRVVAPYCYGISTRGVEILRAIQIRGSSASGRLGIGKLWTVAAIVDPRMLDETFSPDDPNYNPDDSAMRQILCRI